MTNVRCQTSVPVALTHLAPERRRSWQPTRYRGIAEIATKRSKNDLACHRFCLNAVHTTNNVEATYFVAKRATTVNEFFS